MVDGINKSKMITPLITLSAAAIAVVVMYLRDYELYKMLWCLFVVVIIFYIIGDVVQTIYVRIRPRVIPEEEDLEKMLAKKYYGISGIDFVDGDRLEDYVEAARAERTYTDDEIRELIASNKLGMEDEDETVVEANDTNTIAEDNGFDEDNNSSFTDEEQNF